MLDICFRAARIAPSAVEQLAEAPPNRKFIILPLRSIHLIILQAVYQRVKTVAQIVTARATVAASLTMSQRRRDEKQSILNDWER